jgi:quercetin dioxygenase-like cupin family protein
MKLTSLEEAPFKPVSHDPQIKKQVLFGKGALPHIMAISHVEMNPGDSAVSHKHDDGYEVFYGLGGRIDFVVNGEDVPLTQGKCLIVEPGEVHSIRDAAKGSRMIYFFLVK